jgi:hypothetical protein
LSSGAVAWGDYDNDGDLDLAIAGYSGGALISKIYRNDNGSFTDIAADLAGVGNSGRKPALAWGDYDNDGDLDLVIAGWGTITQITKIYRNDNGTFNDSGINNLKGVTNGAVAWGDYDNDGDLDLALLGYSSEGFVTKIYRSNKGSFEDINAGIVNLTDGALAWGDYDNDGDLDLAVSGTDGSTHYARLYQNNNGTFVLQADPEGLTNSSIACGDLDGDGDMDVVVAGMAAGSIRKTVVYQNNGNWNFSEVTPTSLPGIDKGDVALGDENVDGMLELFLVGDTGSGLIARAYQYKPWEMIDPKFSLDRISFSGMAYSGVAYADYDNDQDLDFILIGSNNNSSTSGPWTQIYYSLASDVNFKNPLPVEPASGFSFSFNADAAKLSLQWGDGSDTEQDLGPKGLYYDIRVATTSFSQSVSHYIVSASSAGASPLFGNYPHGYSVALSTQAGLNLYVNQENTTYYWQVRSIDPAFQRSGWSTEQAAYVPNTVPIAPELLNPADPTASKWETQQYDWSDSTDAVTGISGYEIYFSTHRLNFL